MQLELAFLERPAAPAARMEGPWDQIDPQAQIAALDISRVSSRRCSRPAQRWRQAMSDIQKMNSSHLARVAVVYLRQSSCAQVEHNRESTTDSTPWRIRPVSLAGPPIGLSYRRRSGSDRIRRSRAIGLRAADRRGRPWTCRSGVGPGGI